ncbi:hypothetical protein D1816_04770 [Aquimarina sp. AD10]|uniref:hypothetical protein n=1 Tax=Aquimarina sp. AD10 TaxID=1714849 RepID=UPI000E48FF0D|nr:hypothetical protein [Aquimarina sp. AD10]AXT59697.1 hypothetical protein D1816_04770 [Aquimarina sp. AD10]RKM97573.1 hypothetical protein D7033_14350 [Aquimarina sp. AD10]
MLRKYTQIDWQRTLIMLMPPVLRKNRHALWLQVLLKPLSSVYEDTLYKMQHNGQVIYLEKVLNEIFNKSKEYKYYETTQEKADNGLIFLEDADRPRVQYLFTNEEIQNGEPAIITYTRNNEPKREFRYFLYLSSDLDFSSTEYFNFRINLPSSILEATKTYLNEVTSMDKVSYPIHKKQLLLESMSDKLIFELGHPFTSHPDAVKIQTPRFHKVVNFYKLVAKSYETRQYAYTNSEEPSVKAKL